MEVVPSCQGFPFPGPCLPAESAIMSSETDVIAANAAFYAAFTARDFAAMSRLWAARAPVSCTHPGWPPLLGRDAVLSSWRDILAQSEPMRVEGLRPRVQMFGGQALVLCGETLNGRAVLAASNLFTLEDGEWRIVFHQAGQIVHAAETVESAPETPPRVVH